jgi:hypothetical protein
MQTKQFDIYSLAISPQFNKFSVGFEVFLLNADNGSGWRGGNDQRKRHKYR